MVQVPGHNSMENTLCERGGGRGGGGGLGTLKRSPLCTLNLLLYFLVGSHDRVPTTRK